LSHGQPLNFTAGLGLNDVNRESRTIFDPCLPPCEIASKEDIEHRNAYAYGNLTLPEDVVWTLGLSLDDFEEEQFDVQKFNPKLGVQWQITDRLRLRAAAFQTVKRTLIADQTIEPTTIAGFNQFFDNGAGAKTSRYAAALDARVTDRVYAGVELAVGDIDLPVQNAVTGDTELEDHDEELLRAYLYWTPHPWWAFTAEYVLDDFRRQPRTNPLLPTDVDTMEVPLGARFFHPSGLFAELVATYVDQQVQRPPGSPLSDGNSDFVVVDAALGFRLPQRRGIVSLEVKNLLDDSFNFQDDNFRTPQINNPRFIPDRWLLLRGTLTF
jgi:outer membrane receptor protein involved in Fe transport